MRKTKENEKWKINQKGKALGCRGFTRKKARLFFIVSTYSEL
ncbi:hypothetical protein ACLHDF_10065 [Priestia aryabhattai]